MLDSFSLKRSKPALFFALAFILAGPTSWTPFCFLECTRTCLLLCASTVADVGGERRGNLSREGDACVGNCLLVLFFTRPTNRPRLAFPGTTHRSKPIHPHQIAAVILSWAELFVNLLLLTTLFWRDVLDHKI